MCSSASRLRSVCKVAPVQAERQALEPLANFQGRSCGQPGAQSRSRQVVQRFQLVRGPLTHRKLCVIQVVQQPADAVWIR